jgi:hypothetical protein
MKDIPNEEFEDKSSYLVDMETELVAGKGRV